MSPSGCSCRRLQLHHFDLNPFISRLLGAANLGFTVVIRRGRQPRFWVNLTIGDVSSNWITSGLPTTRRSALTLYASWIGRSLLVDSAIAIRIRREAAPT
jgi:hypothetical protein